MWSNLFLFTGNNYVCLCYFAQDFVNVLHNVCGLVQTVWIKIEIDGRIYILQNLMHFFLQFHLKHFLYYSKNLKSESLYYCITPILLVLHHLDEVHVSVYQTIAVKVPKWARNKLWLEKTMLMFHGSLGYWS